MALVERFGHFQIAQGAADKPVELRRSPDEYVFLAFDTRIRRLVELHVLKLREGLHSVEMSSAFERVQLAASVRHGSFIRIIDTGEDGDLVYYSCSLNDGEALAAYIARCGPLPLSVALSLLM